MGPVTDLHVAPQYMALPGSGGGTQDFHSLLGELFTEDPIEL